mmetsp:Transcript_69780/g.157696  ORF Transcript_69780/g.157696 Transcript_69780/m.157696 type:complete len:255 (-) Transcript_69780:184-948(-)
MKIIVALLIASPAATIALAPHTRLSKQTAAAAPDSSASSGLASKFASKAASKAAAGLLALTLAVGAPFSGPLSFAGPLPAWAANEEMSASGITYKLPPPNLANKERCKFVSSAMGQANGARDSQPDFRGCSMQGKSAESYDMSGAIMSDADFSKVNFRDAQLSKGYMVGSTFVGADFSNGIVDRCDFEKANLNGAIFANTVLTSTSFAGADLTDADFTDSYLGDFDQKKLCKNPTLQGENPVTGQPTRISAGCK